MISLAATRFTSLWILARIYRSKAITLYVKIMKAIINDVKDARLLVLEGTNFKLLFIVYHANTTLLALALTTAIKHTIDTLLVGELKADVD